MVKMLWFFIQKGDDWQTISSQGIDANFHEIDSKS